MPTSSTVFRVLTGSTIALLLSAVSASPQSAPRSTTRGSTPQPAPVADSVAPPDYVIGADDVLTISFWRDKDLSSDVVVRPDGKISLQLINDVVAAGLTPDQLRQTVTKAAARFVEDPTVTVVVKQINSRKVFIVGNVAKPGTYTLGGPMTVIQVIALAGGLLDYADKDNIVIVRAEKKSDGEQTSVRVNFSDLIKRKNLKQNIELKPGDTIMVP